MTALVTGAAGFIGSTLVQRLSGRGTPVVAVDALTDVYDVNQKLANVERFDDSVRFLKADLGSADIDELLDGVDVVYHLAGRPGVRDSWAVDFDDYVASNILVTQRLLEAGRRHPLRRFVFASSSSVYGQVQGPSRETDLPKPFSPYGVTKLAAESLASVYAANFGVPVTSLRFFSVYGPRQRPDMGFHRLIEAALHGDAFPMFGDGSQRRDFTFVGDVVDAIVMAGAADLEPGVVLNVGGGGGVSLRDAIDIVGELIGRPVRLDRQPAQQGDVQVTGADLSRIADLLGWSPSTALHEGLQHQLAWHRQRSCA